MTLQAGIWARPLLGCPAQRGILARLWGVLAWLRVTAVKERAAGARPWRAVSVRLWRWQLPGDCRASPVPFAPPLRRFPPVLRGALAPNAKHRDQPATRPASQVPARRTASAQRDTGTAAGRSVRTEGPRP